MGIIEGEEGGWIGRTKTAKDKKLQQLQSAMINLYKADKLVYVHKTHGSHGCNFYITYSDRNCEHRNEAIVSRSKHRAKKSESDPDTMHGPPDRQTHL